MTKRVHIGKVYLYCLLAALLCLLVCSKSSPLYPINDWTDANAYLSSGKGMLAGRVMYRDLYEHKGPLLYALHALACLIDAGSFLGVFMLEVLAVSLYLLAGYALLTLYGAGRTALYALPLLALAMASSQSFQMGDSAEELCMPMLAWSLYSLLRWYRLQAPARMGSGWLLANGALMACVLWVKFTMLGMYLPWLAMLLWHMARRGAWRDVVSTLGWLLLGALLATLPWLLYFGVNGAIGDWLKTYLYDNLFLYQDQPSLGLMARGKAMLQAGLAWVLGNPLYTVPMLFGLLWLPWGRKAITDAAASPEAAGDGKAADAGISRWEITLLWSGFAVLALGVFIGGKSYVYYGLILAAFLPFAALPVCLWAEKLPRLGKRAHLAALCGCAVLAAGLGLWLTPNRADFLRPRADTMQYRFAAIVNQTPGATLLNYGFMDAGFYTACGIAPSVKYFHQTNMNLPEMYEEQARYIAQGLTDYVITRGKQPETITQRYSLIATEDAPPDFWYQKVYLYRRNAQP